MMDKSKKRAISPDKFDRIDYIARHGKLDRAKIYFTSKDNIIIIKFIIYGHFIYWKESNYKTRIKTYWRKDLEEIFK